MFAQLYAAMPLKELPLDALLLFVATFVIVVAKVTLFARRADVEPIARLPLDDGKETRR